MILDRPTRRMRNLSSTPKASRNPEDLTTTQTLFAPSLDLELDSRELSSFHISEERLWVLPGNINMASSAALLGNSTELHLSQRESGPLNTIITLH